MMSSSKLALVGNPNSGKSSLFNVLTGLNQKVGNYPGVTVEKISGELRMGDGQQYTLIDLPGTYSLYPKSEDERISCEILRNPFHEDHPDLVVVVVDVTQLKRGLLLCSQVIDLKIPTILALNMADQLGENGKSINLKSLSGHLGIPVVSISALKKKGIEQLKREIKSADQAPKKSLMNIPGQFKERIAATKQKLETSSDYLAYQALLQPDFIPEKGLLSSTPIESADELIGNEMLVRYDRIDSILEEIKSVKGETENKLSQVLDKVFLNQVGGYLIFLGLLFLIFQALFSWASYPMDLIDGAFASVAGWMQNNIPDFFLKGLIIDGIWAGLGGVVIFIPQIAFLFLFIAILEESGYMSRVVFLMDRIMRPFGFSGRSVIPLIGGMACAIPSIMMARNIPHPKERLITMMVTPLMSCSARLPVYVLLIAIFIPAGKVFGIFSQQALVMMGMYLLGFIMALLMAWVFKQVLGYKQMGVFVTELPIYRMPRWRNVGITIYQKVKAFVLEAGQVILIISIILWFLASFAPGNKFEELEASYASQIEAEADNPEASASLERELGAEKLRVSYAGIAGQFIEPAIEPLGFDWKIGISLITSFAAREVFVGTMATIYSLEEPDEEDPKGLRDKLLAERDPDTGNPVYTPAVALSLMIFYAFAMQCMSTLAVTKRETNGWKWPVIMFVYLTALAYVASLITYQVMS